MKIQLKDVKGFPEKRNPEDCRLESSFYRAEGFNQALDTIGSLWVEVKRCKYCDGGYTETLKICRKCKGIGVIVEAVKDTQSGEEKL